MTFPIEALSTPPTAADFAALQALLRDAVEGGASVGYLGPVREAEMVSFWQGVFADVAAGTRVVLVSRDAGRIVGSVQLGLATRPNSLHRAELQKLLVLRSHRGSGLRQPRCGRYRPIGKKHKSQRECNRCRGCFCRGKIGAKRQACREAIGGCSV